MAVYRRRRLDVEHFFAFLALGRAAVFGWDVAFLKIVSKVLPKLDVDADLLDLFPEQ